MPTVTLTKTQATNNFCEAFQQWLTEYDPTLTPSQVREEAADQLKVTRLGSVTLITEAELSKAFVSATENYARRRGPAGWGNLQPKPRKPAPINADVVKARRERAAASDLALRQARRCGY